DLLLGGASGRDLDATEFLVEQSQWVVAVDAETGETAWRIEGAAVCPAALEAHIVGDVVTLCTGAGRVLLSGEGGEDVDDAAVRATAIGVDRRTGDVVWERALAGTGLDVAYQPPFAL